VKHSIVTRIMRQFTALAVIVFAFGVLSYAQCTSQQVQKPKKGKLNITAPTQVAGVTLEPGNYEVKEVKSSSGLTLRFTRVVFNPYVLDGESPYDWQTVAEVKVTTQALCSDAPRTELMIASDNHRPIGLEIRGNSLEYLF
jgi:hypothetical protein